MHFEIVYIDYIGTYAFTVIMGINILKTQFKQFGLSDQYYIY